MKKKRRSTQTQSLANGTKSAARSAQTTITRNKGIAAAIGGGAAVAGYLFGTEHGRHMQSRIAETVKDSYCRIRGGVSTGVDKVRSVVQNQLKNLDEQTIQGEPESEIVRPEKLRRAT
jgi:hypothetical protein